MNEEMIIVWVWEHYSKLYLFSLMNNWIDEWMNKGMSEWINEWIHERTDERMNEGKKLTIKLSLMKLRDE